MGDRKRRRFFSKQRLAAAGLDLGGMSRDQLIARRAAARSSLAWFLVSIGGAVLVLAGFLALWLSWHGSEAWRLHVLAERGVRVHAEVVRQENYASSSRASGAWWLSSEGTLFHHRFTAADGTVHTSIIDAPLQTKQYDRVWVHYLPDAPGVNDASRHVIDFARNPLAGFVSEIVVAGLASLFLLFLGTQLWLETRRLRAERRKIDGLLAE